MPAKAGIQAGRIIAKKLALWGTSPYPYSLDSRFRGNDGSFLPLRHMFLTFYHLCDLCVLCGEIILSLLPVSLPGIP
jgi:hypothetical protein